MINIKEVINFTESDVEMKIIYPLLKSRMPEGLGIEEYNIQTKSSLKKILIDKGANSKLYYPDFAITISGIPLMIVEAKKPNEDLQEAYRQACLYANEINREYPTNINPCRYIIACDGLNLYAGQHDSSPEYQIPIQKWVLTDVDFDAFLENFNLTKLSSQAIAFRNRIGTDIKFKNPISLLGGKKIRNQEASNTFGDNISIQYRHLFNPNQEVEKKDVVENAYVKQSKIEAQVLPINNILNKKISIDNDLTTTLQSYRELNNQVLLLIGSVGSGKSTFTTYLKEVALNEDIRKSTFWININLNDAPLNKDEIYKWIKTFIINTIKKSVEGQDSDSLDFIIDLYEEEIVSLKKGVLSLFDENDVEYKKILAENILKYQEDANLTINKLIKKVLNKNQKDLIVVLDNCDKRNAEEQLLMFEVASWIKENIKAIVFLPLRDTTFENYKFEKPLDTVIKDLIFTINPPSLEQVLTSRISYISKLSKSNKNGYYTLSNGIKVKYPSKDEESYLLSILNSLFSNNFFKELIFGFAGRNIRTGIEIFLDFCKSGHVNESEITKIIKSDGSYTLPNHLISKVFIRGNKVYYTDANSRIKNLFHSIPTDELKDPFIRISILKKLFDTKQGASHKKRFSDYLRTEELVQFMCSIGHDENRIIDELKCLLKFNLIENESLDSDAFHIEDLIRITSIGIANYKIVRNIDYLAAIAEDMWYKDNKLADEIVANLSGNGEYAHLSIQCVSNHARKMVNYLSKYYQENFTFLNGKLINTDFYPVDFDQLNSDIDDFNKNIKTDTIPNLDANTVYEASIVNIQNYGMICEIVDTSFYGLLHSSCLPKDFIDSFALGNTLKVKIIRFEQRHNKYTLELAND